MSGRRRLEDGWLCPEHAHAPQTRAGRHVAAALDRPGVWKRAGLTAPLVGLDLNEALASLPADIDRDLARRYLIAAEGPYLAAWYKANPSKDTKANDG